MGKEEIMSGQLKIITLSVIAQMLIYIVFIPFLPMLVSRRWDWWEAWVYALFGILGFFITRVLVAKRHPDLIAERAKFTEHEDIKPWDKTLSRLVGLGGALIPLVAGLDMRDGWSTYEFVMIWKVVALILITAGYAFSSWALIENRFFSGVVRIQKERGHHLVSTGPYAWVRHPGYAGALLTYFLIPILLDSFWTFVPVIIITVVLIIRCALEDQTLQAELPGYKEYIQKTRWRLLPGIW
jgi:protein-S-isoprenylcysteine O-methyltransferase Ste14